MVRYDLNMNTQHRDTTENDVSSDICVGTRLQMNIKLLRNVKYL